MFSETYSLFVGLGLGIVLGILVSILHKPDPLESQSWTRLFAFSTAWIYICIPFEQRCKGAKVQKCISVFLSAKKFGHYLVTVKFSKLWRKLVALVEPEARVLSFKQRCLVISIQVSVHLKINVHVYTFIWCTGLYYRAPVWLCSHSLQAGTKFLANYFADTDLKHLDIRSDYDESVPVPDLGGNPVPSKYRSFIQYFPNWVTLPDYYRVSHLSAMHWIISHSSFTWASRCEVQKQLVWALIETKSKSRISRLSYMYRPHAPLKKT